MVISSNIKLLYSQQAMGKARNFCTLGKLSFLRPRPFPFGPPLLSLPSLALSSQSLPCPPYTTPPFPFAFLTRVWGYNPGKTVEITDARKWVLAHSGSKHSTQIKQHFLPLKFTFSSIPKVPIPIPFSSISISYGFTLEIWKAVDGGPYS